jgi:hypothetical protein
MNTMTNLSNSSMKTEFMKYMNCAGAFVNPKGITKYLYRPYLVVKAVLGISLTQILIWFLPEWKSILENTYAPAS